jgi:hypothetical protein
MKTQTTFILIHQYRVRVRVMVFKATFNNMSILMVEDTGVPRENHRPAASP